MSEHSRSPVRAFVFVTILGTIVTAVILFQRMSAPDTDRRNWPVSFVSDGQALYFTGRSLSGSRMLASGGNHHMVMMGTGACVDCHGTDRKGGRPWPMIWRVIPSLEADNLVDDHAHAGHNHDTYTADTLAVAITAGKRPDGSTLGKDMPRWTMSDADLRALTTFLLSQ